MLWVGYGVYLWGRRCIWRWVGAFVFVFFYDIRLRLWSLLLHGGERIAMVYRVVLLCGVTVFAW